jgi:hypothetical protein
MCIQLTSEEKKFVEFARALADWLEAYHDHARPPPHVVLAEAAKQTELKTGHPLKGLQITPPPNGTDSKKDQEPPAVTEAPALLNQYFVDAQARFAELQKSGDVVDLLHLATLVQEAFLFFNVETLRFKSPSVIKINKLGGVRYWSSFQGTDIDFTFSSLFQRSRSSVQLPSPLSRRSPLICKRLPMCMVQQKPARPLPRLANRYPLPK